MLFRSKDMKMPAEAASNPSSGKDKSITVGTARLDAGANQNKLAKAGEEMGRVAEDRDDKKADRRAEALDEPARPLETDTGSGAGWVAAAPVGQQASKQMLQKQFVPPPYTYGPNAVVQSRQSAAAVYDQLSSAKAKSIVVADSARLDSLKRIRHLADSLKRYTDSLRYLRSKRHD